MKYKLSALILGLTFGGVSQAGIINWTITGFAAVQFPLVANTDTLTGTAGSSGPFNLTYGTTATNQLLFNVVVGAANTATANDTIPTQGNTITANEGGGPNVVASIVLNYLDTINVGAGGGTNPRTHVLTLTGGTPTLFFNFANGDRLRVSNITMAANTTTTNNATPTANSASIGISGDLLLTTPEPGTWMLLGSSLIGLGLFARRRKTTIQS